jgi:hypothetical protein
MIVYAGGIVGSQGLLNGELRKRTITALEDSKVRMHACVYAHMHM